MRKGHCREGSAGREKENPHLAAAAVPPLGQSAAGVTDGRITRVNMLCQRFECVQMCSYGFRYALKKNKTILQGVFFNWYPPKNHKFFSVSKMFPTFELVPP